MKRLVWIIFVVIPLTIAIVGLLWITRPWSQYGIGSHEQVFDNYAIRIPYGWIAEPAVPDERSPSNSRLMHRGLIAAGSIWFSTCIIRIDSADEYAAEVKAGRKFPNTDTLQTGKVPKPTVSPTEKLTINGTQFERAYWAVKVANRAIKGVEYRSAPTVGEDVVSIGANPGFGPPGELAQAEYMISTLRRVKH
jgi:hypothetical protein